MSLIPPTELRAHRQTRQRAARIPTSSRAFRLQLDRSVASVSLQGAYHPEEVKSQQNGERDDVAHVHMRWTAHKISVPEHLKDLKSCQAACHHHDDSNQEQARIHARQDHDEACDNSLIHRLPATI
eukprot:752807-Hanusia_phi.AAC.3